MRVHKKKPDFRIRRGAAAELEASKDLLDLGFDVYRSVSPAAPFDLAVHYEGKVLRVEVKMKTQKGVHFPPQLDTSKFDLLAVVDSETYQVGYVINDKLPDHEWLKEVLKGKVSPNNPYDLYYVWSKDEVHL